MVSQIITHPFISFHEMTMNSIILKETNMKPSSQDYILNVKDLSQNSTNTFNKNGFCLSIFHLEGEPEMANRVRISNQYLEVEMLPSKGFSLSQAWIHGTPVFWDAPSDLPDTETIDLWSDEICINGVPSPGFTYLKTFIAGVELLGMRNWGMPVTANNRLLPLHGETSNIPVKELLLEIKEDNCTLQASFIYRTFDKEHKQPWYENGEELFKVTKKLILNNNSTKIRIEDSFENISKEDQLPDWGYHVTFRPELGAKYLVSARHAERRGGGALPKDFEVWQASPDNFKRIEHGTIYKGLSDIDTSGLHTSMLLYPDGKGIVVKTTPSPYFQTWFCSGGAGSSEFTWKNREPVLKRNWDGIGIEFGSCALDHDGNTDPEVENEKVRKPGESRKIVIEFEFFN